MAASGSKAMAYNYIWASAGIPVASEATPLPDGSDRVYIDDPFGNRIELIAGL